MNLIKKKPVPKKNPDKNKGFKEHGDSIITTKERTFATIEETFEFCEHGKGSNKSTTHNTSRRDYLEKMEANHLSPFSSPEKSYSSSAKREKHLSPMIVKVKDRKEKGNGGKSGCSPSLGNLTRKGKKDKDKEKSKGKDKGTKGTKSKNAKVGYLRVNSQVDLIQQYPKSTKKAQFQNEFLNKINFGGNINKKITELSEEEMEMSIGRGGAITSHIGLAKGASKVKKGKKELIKEMFTKVKEKYRKMYPNLHKEELKVLSAVVLIQRLWRQTKVKMMIGQFLSPRNPHATSSYNEEFNSMMNKKAYESCNSMYDEEKSNEKDQKRLNLTPNSEKNNSEQKVLYESSSKKVEKLKNSGELVERSELNLKDLEISSELSENSPLRNKNFLKYVDSYREIVLKSKKQCNKSKKTKENAFNLQGSLSEKCLLQKLYRKRLKAINNIKSKNNCESSGNIDTYDVFFPLKSSEKSKEHFKSPKKPEIVELEERFYTEVQDDYPPKSEKEIFKLEEQTVGTIGNIATHIVKEVIDEFCEEYRLFATKKCLKKKKRLPGIFVNEVTITNYLNSYLEYIFNNFPNHFEIAFNKIGAESFLKIFRVLPDEDIFEPGEEEEDEGELNFPVVPNSAFFEYQPIYEHNEFVIKDEDKKYSNFLSGLIRIHNKCLADCFCELLEKERIESIEFPWDCLGLRGREGKGKGRIGGVLERIKERVVEISGIRLGKLYRKDSDVEESNLLSTIKQEYKTEGKEWGWMNDFLEIRLEIAEIIGDLLMKEMWMEISL